MDLVAGCKDKLTYFRIKELKDVLTQLGLSKQGKKQDLIDRILATLSDEQDIAGSKMWPKKGAVGKETVAKLVNDIHRKMQASGATDSASKSEVASDISSVKVKGEVDGPYQLDAKVRCPCGISLETGSMIKCEDQRCHVLQHIDCVIIPEKPMEGGALIPVLFYCEICRLSRADPFWVTVEHPLYPVKFTATNITTDGTNPVQCMEKTFHLTRAQKDLLLKPEYDVQAWCMLLNDKVSFRMQWPQLAELKINGVTVRAINRPGSQLLGANGRDDGPIITPYTKDGINKISLTGCDTRIFCFGVRIVKRQTIQQILSSIPKESDGERFEDALARVVRCVGGGAARGDADSDSDVELVADSFAVNLRCPMSGSRMKVAGRFKPCVHMGCFDLEVFVELNQRSRKWQCPICLKNYSVEYMIIDPYFNRITSKMRHCGEDVTEIEVKPDGSWRTKTRNESECRELGELAQWHSPDGALCVPTGELGTEVEMSMLINQEGISVGHTALKLEIRKNHNGNWEVTKPKDMNASSSGNRLHGIFWNHEQKVIPMSSSATGSGRDGEDPSVNQDGQENIDFPNSGIELDSFPLNLDSAFGFTERNPSAAAGDAEVIVLSDSEDENAILTPSGAVYDNSNRTDVGGSNFSLPPPVVADPYSEDPSFGPGANSCMDLYNANDDEFGMPLWPLPSGFQSGPGFQFFSSDVDGLVDLQNGSISCPPSMNGYSLAPEATLGSAPVVPDSSVGRTDVNINDSLVDSPLPFGGHDPSLQIFLPTRPSDALLQTDLRGQPDVPNGRRTDDWISLRLGGGTSVGHRESPTVNVVNSRQQMPSREGSMNSLAEHASLLLGLNDGRNEKASQQSSGSPFLFPRQKRSVRPRLYLSIDSDSE